MKNTFYSSTFFSLIIALLVFLGGHGETITIVQDMEYSFSNIEKLSTNTHNPEIFTLPITIEVFYSFGCFDCRNFALNTIPLLQEKYLEDEDVDLKLYVTPIPDNEDGYYAVTGVHCASEYGKYWEMHNKIHETNSSTSREIDLLGQELDLPVLEFRSCLKSGKYDEEIGVEIDYAYKKEITKMPTVLIGKYRLYGNQPIENIVKIVNEILSE